MLLTSVIMMLTGLWLSGWSTMVLDIGLIIGAILGLALAPAAALALGWASVLKHYVLRFFLFDRGVAPLRLVAFLEDAVERGILYREGGGYRFAHGMLREHLALSFRGDARAGSDVLSVDPCAPSREPSDTSAREPSTRHGN